MKRIQKCDKCSEQFIQTYINYKKKWSQINEISYWTNGKEWENYNHFCRSCLKKWFEFERESFNNLVAPEKQKLFLDYKYRGTLDKNDYLK